MNGNDLLAGMGHIDEKYVEEGELGTIRRKKLPIGWLSLAACLCIVVCAALLLPNLSASSTSNECAMEDCAVECEEETMAAVEYKDILSGTEVAVEWPTLTLRIEEWDETGFTATVIGSEDTDLFSPGTEVRVRFSEDMGVETAQDSVVTYESGAPTEAEFPAGTVVAVRLVSWTEDEAGVIILIESITLD